VIDFTAPETRRNPYPLYARLRAAAPVLRDPRSGTWMLLDYESVKRALTDHATFSSDVSNAGFGTHGWMIFADPPRHTKLRALVLRAFTPRAVAQLEPRVREIARGLLDRTAGKGEMELVTEFSVPLPLMVIAELLGAPIDDWPRFRAWSDTIMALANTVAPGPEAERAVARFRAAHGEMRDYLVPLLAHRRAAPADDLLTRLTAAV
jgi:cytochrome P450